MEGLIFGILRYNSKPGLTIDQNQISLTLSNSTEQNKYNEVKGCAKEVSFECGHAIGSRRQTQKLETAYFA